MGRFYFHVVEGAELLTDVEGAHLRDALEARQMAIRSAREILADAIRAARTGFLRRSCLPTNRDARSRPSLLPSFCQSPSGSKAASLAATFMYAIGPS